MKRKSKPLIHRRHDGIYIGDSSLKWTIIPFLLSILLIAGLTYLNCKLQSSNSNTPPQQIQSKQTEQTKSGFI
nr:MAG TPA: HCMV UL42 [Bacteriophage sp.]